MLKKQDRTPVRTPAHIEQKYDLSNKDYSDIKNMATNAQQAAERAASAANSAVQAVNGMEERVKKLEEAEPDAVGEVYSTEERVVGTWINGKPLYSKTVVASYTTDDVQNIAHGIENAELIWLDHQNTFFVNSVETASYFAPGISGGTVANAYTKIIQTINNTNFVIRGCANAGSGTVYVTIRYTKTTDDVVSS